MESRELFVAYGEDMAAMTAALLKCFPLLDALPKGAHIGLKPNLVVARPAAGGATTHPEIVEAVVRCLMGKGLQNICILESAWVGDSTKRAFQVCGYADIAARCGVPLYDVKEDRYVSRTAAGISAEISRRALGLDFLISLPVLKGHCQTGMTCALKNMKGLISDRSKRQFHAQGLMRPIAALNKMICADLVVVDAMNGDLDFEEGGNPVPTHRMFACRDSVLADSYGAALMGYEPAEIEYIPLAQKLGVGSMDLDGAKITVLGGDAPAAAPVSTRKIRALEKYVCASAACSACYGSLINALARLQEQGLLPKLDKKIYIGQGYKGKSLDGLGIGACTAAFGESVGGCPPAAVDIVRRLRRLAGAP